VPDGRRLGESQHDAARGTTAWALPMDRVYRIRAEHVASLVHRFIARVASSPTRMMRRRNDRPVSTEFDTERERVLAELRDQIRSRLGPVIGHLPQAEIDHLIDRIARFKYRHEGKAALRSTPPRGVEVDQ